MDIFVQHGGAIMEVIDVYMAQAPIVLIFGLVVFIVIDYITGLLRALYEKKGNSKTHYKGLVKKVGIICGVMLGSIADIVLSGGTPIFTTMIAMLFIAGEGLSIIENLGVLGIRIPKRLADRLVQIQENDGEDKKE